MCTKVPVLKPGNRSNGINNKPGNQQRQNSGRGKSGSVAQNGTTYIGNNVRASF